MILTCGLLIRPALRNHAHKAYSDVVVCTAGDTGGGWWNCIVVKGSETYPRGGYDIAVHADYLRNGIVYEATEAQQ
jgi:hypothetical protein